MSSLSGKRLGDYEIIGELGEGAMGKVYLARNILLPTIQVVLKILKDTGQKERFLAEATNLSRLGHKNICQLRHFFHSGDDLVLAMEYIDGRSLADLANQWTGADLARVKSIALQILDGLDHAHRMGVCHRDIKLSNIMINRLGVAKLIDFGIARHSRDPRHTGTGMSVGTPQYMAPEQFTEEHLDDYTSCDIYSLGICLYQMCCGRLPFQDTNPFILKEKHCLEMPPLPSSLNKDVNYALQKVIMRAIAKRPSDRFASAAEMRDALAAAERGSDPLSETFHTPPRTTPAAQPKPVSRSGDDPTAEPKSGRPAEKSPQAVQKRTTGTRWTGKKIGWWFAALVVALGCIAVYFAWDREPPRIVVEPDGLSFEGPRDGSLPTARSFSITNTGGGTLNWSISHSSTWLSIEPSAGSSNNATITARITTTNQPLGTYHDTICVTSANAETISQRVPVAYAVHEPGLPAPPKLRMKTAFNAYYGRPIAFDASIDLGGADDSLLSFSIHPLAGITKRRLSPTDYEITFVPFPGCPDSYEVLFAVEGRGGSDSVRARFFIQGLTQAVILHISPPSRLLMDGTPVTENLVADYRANIAPEIQNITIMNPRYPLFSVPVDDARSTFQESVDLNAVYSGTKTVELRMNIVGDGSAALDAERSILINGDFTCALKERCRFVAGRYLIQPAPDFPLTIDSAKFNGKMGASNMTFFRLQTPAEGVRFNTLIFYVH